MEKKENMENQSYEDITPDTCVTTAHQVKNRASPPSYPLLPSPPPLPFPHKYVIAPMVNAGDLPFRLLCRKYGADLCFTPMLYSHRFATEAGYRRYALDTIIGYKEKETGVVLEGKQSNMDNKCSSTQSKIIPPTILNTDPRIGKGANVVDRIQTLTQTQTHAEDIDRPLIIQFCGNDPQILLEAALLAQDYCDGIDINLGCPQREARTMLYGSFLLDPQYRPLILNIVKRLSSHPEIRVPICCKIRLLPELEDTIVLCRELQQHGCRLLTVHGRMKGQPHMRRCVHMYRFV